MVAAAAPLLAAPFPAAPPLDPGFRPVPYWRTPRPDRWENEPAELRWLPETRAQRRRRRRRLRLIDRVMFRLEEFNLAEGGEQAAPFEFVRAYHALGGEVLWGAPWPAGGDLHQALLELQYDWLRPPLPAG